LICVSIALFWVCENRALEDQKNQNHSFFTWVSQQLEQNRTDHTLLPMQDNQGTKTTNKKDSVFYYGFSCENLANSFYFLWYIYFFIKLPNFILDPMKKVICLLLPPLLFKCPFWIVISN
jgi:hypothetical protein